MGPIGTVIQADILHYYTTAQSQTTNIQAVGCDLIKFRSTVAEKKEENI